MDLQHVTGDLLDQQVDCIVNAWNRNIIPWWLLIPQGVSGAIKRRAGLEPFREVARAGAMPLGTALATTAGNLPHKAIIHVAGINLLWRASEFSIRASTRNALSLATDLGFHSIAFPLIGAGSGGRSTNFSFETMSDELHRCSFNGSVSIVRWGGAG